MSFIPIPNTVQAQMVYTYFGQICENVLHVESNTAWDVARMGTLATALKSWHDTNLRPVQGANASLEKFIVKDVQTEAGEGVEIANTTNKVGTMSGDALTANVTLAIKLGTGLAGRSFRGRLYHIGMTHDQLSATSVNAISATAQGNLITAYVALLSLLTAASMSLVVASRRHANAPRVEGVVTPVISMTVDLNTDSQRRRLNARGR